MDAKAFITNLIRDYYKNVSDFPAPEAVSSREFGVGTFERKILYRHIEFKSKNDLRKYLIENAPPYISCSTAHYKFPAARPMEKKGWLGSELVFDLDVTDMHLPCQSAHGRSWVCAVCFEEIKNETIKLIEEFLIPDFGFSSNELEVNFSGNRGYHVHVKNDSVLTLDANQRKEISDYISGNGIEVEDIFENMGQKGHALLGPKPDDIGWKGKLARSFITTLNSGTEQMTKLGIDKRIANNLYKKRALVELGIKNGNWDMVYIKNKADFWKTILANQAIAQSDRIDRNVTKDPSHLIRLPESIHGETGLIAKKVGIAALSKFDPMNDAIAFRNGEMEVIANSQQKLLINNEQYGPFNKEKVKLPVYAGTYLYLKGLADII
jgi:DNA primase small subunit